MARNKYPEETRALIIETATKLFVEVGYESTSIQDIINHLGGLSKGAIYHHFKSKEDILVAVLDNLTVQTEERIYELVEDHTLTGQEKLKEMFLLSIEDNLSGHFMNIVPAFYQNPRLLTMQMQVTMEHVVPSVILPVIKEGIKDGTIHTKYPKQLAEAVMLMVNLWINPFIFQSTLEEMEEKMLFCRELFASYGITAFDDTVFQKIQYFKEQYQKILNKDQ